MAPTPQQKSWCVLQLAKTESVTAVQRAFRTHFHQKPPTRVSISTWYKHFEENDCICKGKSSGRPPVSEQDVDRVRTAFLRSPQKSTRRASRELQIPQTTISKILRKRLRMKPYRLQLVQALTPGDYAARSHFSTEMLTRMENDENLLKRLIFSDEATFHTNGKVNRHNVRVWGTEHPHITVEHERDSPKVNVFCAMSREKIYGPFFFMEKTVTGITYLDMISLWLLPQLQDDSDNFILQQDGAPPHFHLAVREHLNTHLPGRWLGRAGVDNDVWCHWPPRSPDLTPCDFFLWGYVKDQVFVPPLPQSLQQLRQRISTAVQSITNDMLCRVWDEFEYRLDVCRVTKGAHIESL